jgi:hypothetical protein
MSASACICWLDAPTVDEDGAYQWACAVDVAGVYHGHVLSQDGAECDILYMAPPVVDEPTWEIFHPHLIHLCPVHGVPALHGPLAIGMHALRTWYDLECRHHCAEFHQSMRYYPLFRGTGGRIYTEPRKTTVKVGYIRPPFVYLFNQGGQFAPHLSEIEYESHIHP